MRRATSALILAMLGAPSVAGAQEDPARRDLIARATQARDRGDHAGALALAREAAARRMSPSLRTFIAQEESSLGLVREALDDARRCVSDAEADASLANRGALLNECRALVADLSARAAPPAATPAAPVAAPPQPLAAARAPETERAVIAPVARPRSGPGAGPWVVVGLGVASVAASGLFYALRNGAIDARDAQCGGTSGPCDLTTTAAVQAVQASQDSANTYNALTNVALGVGGAAVAGGLTWFLLGASGSDEAPRAALLFVPSRGGGYLGVQGAL